MPGFDVISEIFGQFAPVEQIDTERQIAFVESQVGDLLKAEAGGTGEINVWKLKTGFSCSCLCRNDDLPDRRGPKRKQERCGCASAIAVGIILYFCLRGLLRDLRACRGHKTTLPYLPGSAGRQNSGCRRYALLH
jgi:hypothetical protein